MNRHAIAQRAVRETLTEWQYRDMGPDRVRKVILTPQELETLMIEGALKFEALMVGLRRAA